MYDTILLSPFKEKMYSLDYTRYGSKSPLRPRITADPWNSVSIPESSKALYIKEMDSVMQKLTKPTQIKKMTYDDVLHKPKEFQFGKATPSQVVEKQVVDFMTKLKLGAVTEGHNIEVSKLKDNLQSFPEIANNLESEFMAWQLAAKEVVKDVSLINEADVKGFNDFIANPRKDPKMLSKWEYYKDPDTISWEHFMKGDRIYFEGLDTPVKSSDGLLRREIKKMTSTKGFMKDLFNKMDNEKQYHIERAETDNLKLIKFRRSDLNEAEVLDINRLVVLRKEANRSAERMQLLNPEIVKLEESLSKRVKDYEKIAGEAYEAYSRDAEKFGKDWIYENEVAEKKFIRFNKDGSFDMDNFVKQVGSPYTGKDFNLPPLETILRAQYELTLNKTTSSKEERLKSSKFTKWKIGTEEVDTYWHKIYGNYGADVKAID